METENDIWDGYPLAIRNKTRTKNFKQPVVKKPKYNYFSYSRFFIFPLLYIYLILMI